ncbi:hypothetical protein A4X16_14540 [Microbacterium sp. H83]|nr:hypothetical protein A4X16_14540 [Microbacterium sp. H83]
MPGRVAREIRSRARRVGREIRSRALRVGREIRDRARRVGREIRDRARRVGREIEIVPGGPTRSTHHRRSTSENGNVLTEH